MLVGCDGWRNEGQRLSWQRHGHCGKLTAVSMETSATNTAIPPTTEATIMAARKTPGCRRIRKVRGRGERGKGGRCEKNKGENLEILHLKKYGPRPFLLCRLLEHVL